jgi:hypothetical protein
MVIYEGNRDATHFLNVDLDLHSKTDLEPLVSALGRKVLKLHVGRIGLTYCVHLEVERRTKDADSTIRAFCALIKSLPSSERELWNAATKRDFNIGVQAGTHPFSHEIVLASETVKSASELCARIVFTVYAPEKQLSSSPVNQVPGLARTK